MEEQFARLWIIKWTDPEKMQFIRGVIRALKVLLRTEEPSNLAEEF